MISSADVFGSYLVTLAAATALAASLIVVALFVVDPYGLYPSIPGVSPSRSADLFWHLRVHKPYALEEIEADHLIIGSSRSARLSPAALAPRGAVAYNASMPGISLYEITRTVEHANVIKPLTTVVVGLDYYMFSDTYRPDYVALGFEDDRLLRSNATLVETLRHRDQRLYDLWSSLFSVDALRDSYRTWSLGQSSQRTFFDDGTWETSLPPHWAGRPVYKVLAQQKFQQFKEQTGELDMSRLADMLDYGEAHGIEFRFLLSPFHALAMNVVGLAGSWDGYLRWQREVVATVESHSNSARVFGLEDNPRFITEPFDAEEAFFEDGVHYTAWASDRILTCLLAEGAPCEAGLKIAPLNSDNIDGYLESITAAMEDYPRTHPSEYATLQGWLALD